MFVEWFDIVVLSLNGLMGLRYIYIRLSNASFWK